MNDSNFDLIAEQYVLASLLIDGDSFQSISDIVKENDFFHLSHRIIFNAMSECINEYGFIDIINVSQKIEQNGQLNEVGGLPYISGMADSHVTSSRLKSYAQVLLEKSSLRKISEISQQLAFASSEKIPTSEILKNIEIETENLKLRLNALKDFFEHVKNVLTKNIDKLTELYSRDGSIIGKISGISTGINDLDRAICGLNKGKLIVVAGRPGMGKSAFAMGIVENVAINEKKSVAVFSMEMLAEELTMRMISSVGKINSDKLRRGDLDDRDWERVSLAIGKLSETEIYFDSTPGLNFSDLSARIVKIKNKKNVDVIVVDYLQLMQFEKRTGTMAGDIGEVTKALKTLANRLEITIILLSQLNRKCEERPNKRPIPSDLRDSGSIEQDADLLILLYRDEKNNHDSEHKGIAELIIAKQRGGAEGTLFVRWDGEYTKFSNLDNGQDNFVEA